MLLVGLVCLLTLLVGFDMVVDDEQGWNFEVDWMFARLLCIGLITGCVSLLLLVVGLWIGILDGFDSLLLDDGFSVIVLCILFVFVFYLLI